MIHQNQRTLILNSTFHPLSVVSYKRAIALIYSKKINSLKNKILNEKNWKTSSDWALKLIKSGKPCALILIRDFID